MDEPPKKSNVKALTVIILSSLHARAADELI